ncbi:Kazal-type serine protease inhibitor family protein [Chelativorans sp. YIM 93263]|uniref:Kazal-type serine protease inhibitor family protein n=1 Tax=Chelativorans sp. YIM 93263 TaxID=2906648 RepID=UPI002379ADE1|nr:Kazal-type serine protease inhibitor [Chelativorans sp. YIM 93263]
MFRAQLASFGAVLLAGLFLSSCVVAVEEGPIRPFPPGGPGPQACTMEYDPVCAERRGDRRTFGNACTARSEGYRPVHSGQCQRQSQRPPQACTREYRPVCAVRGNDRRTFPNACEAESRNYRVARRGECGPSSGRPPSSEPPQVCTQQYAPVCARRGNRTRTFGNACEAQAAEYRIVRRGEC